MASLKSLSEDFVLGLLQNCFADLQAKYPHHCKSLTRDLVTLVARFACEGISFAVKTLPKLGKALDLALEEGSIVTPREFKRAHKGGTIPAFMQGMFMEVFDDEGFLREEPSTEVIRDLRQVLFLVYKYQLPYSTAQEEAIIGQFLATEEEIATPPAYDEETWISVNQVRRLAVGVFKGFDPKNMIPRHGPGSVATGETGDSKWLFARNYTDLTRVFPYHEYFMVRIPSNALWEEDFHQRPTTLTSGVAKVALVPKDSRGPRLISCEPLEYQYVQQGINREVVNLLQSHRLTKGHINFQDQTVNQKLAMEGSITRQWCTIDLKDASDRVSLWGISRMFQDLPELLETLYAARSTHTTLPDGRVVRLRKFAPMGSALCFSIEAFYFWAICVEGVRKAHKVPLNDAAKLVYVYGDDIIVPTDCYESVRHELESWRLVTNDKKSCHRGSYRESCGIQAFNGVDITATRLSTLWSAKPSDPSCLASFCSYYNALLKKGWNLAAAYLLGKMEKVFGPIPYGVDNSSYPCIHASSRSYALLRNAEKGFRVRWHKDFQRYEQRVLTVKPVIMPSKLDGWPRLLRALTRNAGDRPTEVVLPRNTRLAWSWKP